MYSKIIALCLSLLFVSLASGQEEGFDHGENTLPEGSFIFPEAEKSDQNIVLPPDQTYSWSLQANDGSLEETTFFHDDPDSDQEDVLFEQSCVFLFQDDDIQEENNSFPEEEENDSNEKRPPPFEKIYVSPHEILSTYEGSFYLSRLTGEYEPVRAISRDCKGTYIIKIAHECPICGRYCCGKTPPEGYTCPLWSKEVYPHIWVNP